MHKLKVGICGTLSPDTPREKNPLPALRDERVQDFILQLNRAPTSKKEIISECPSVGKQVEHLLRLGVLREKAGKIWVNFTLFNAEDQRLVRAVAEEHAEQFAGDLMQKKSVLWDILAKHRNPFADLSQMAYAAVGCYFLDLAALHIAGQRHQMSFQKKQPGGNRYTLWAEESGSLCLKAVYWGCHSLQTGEFVFQTFGDHHHETQRKALPDILYRQPDVDFPGSKIYKSLLFEHRQSLAEEIGRILSEAADGPVSMDDVGQIHGVPAERFEKMVNLLSFMGYLCVEEGTVTATTPYFGTPDIPVLEGVFTECIPVFNRWCDENLHQIEQQLQRLRPLQNGVPFDEVFIQVWHHIFGLTNKELAKRGLIYDTYSGDSLHTGYLPMVCESAVIKKLAERWTR